MLTLVMIYMSRHAPFFHKAYGSPHIWVLLHITKVLAFGLYFAYVIWAVNRDVVTIDLLMMKDKHRYTRVVQLSFNAKLYLLFGTPSLFGALFGPCLEPLPMNGIEYEHEQI